MQNFKNISLFILTIGFFGLAALFLLQRNTTQKNEAEQMSNNKADSILRVQMLTYTLNYGNFINVPLTKSMVVTDINNNRFSLQKLIDKRMYIFHFDETNCFTCVEKYLPFLKRISSKLGKGKVIIIGSYRRPSNLFLSLEGFDLTGIAEYNLDPSYLNNTEIGSINVPYIFATDQSLKTYRFYIPEKSMPILSEIYEKNTFKN